MEEEKKKKKKKKMKKICDVKSLWAAGEKINCRSFKVLSGSDSALWLYKVNYYSQNS